MLPSTSVAFALGVCFARPQQPETAARLTALIGELRARGVYPDLLASLDDTLRRQLDMAERMARGQMWNQGQTPSY